MLTVSTKETAWKSIPTIKSYTHFKTAYSACLLRRISIAFPLEICLKIGKFKSSILYSQYLGEYLIFLSSVFFCWKGTLHKRSIWRNSNLEVHPLASTIYKTKFGSWRFSHSFECKLRPCTIQVKVVSPTMAGKVTKFPNMRPMMSTLSWWTFTKSSCRVSESSDQNRGRRHRNVLPGGSSHLKLETPRSHW